MTETAPIELLRTLRTLAEGGGLPSPLGAWLAVGMMRYEAAAIAGDPVSLERCLGLGSPGRPNWVASERKAARNRQLEQIYRQNFLGIEPAEAARQIRATYLGVIDLPGHRQLANIIRKFAA